MERKLELRDICGYLPYRLTLASPKTLYCSGKDCFIDKTIEQIKSYLFSGGFKIVLRPLSDIYRTITHNGKEITPIIELAKIWKNCDWKLRQSYFAYNKVEKENFAFKHGNFSVITDDMNCYYVNFQYQLFDYLHELKIDYRGLIDSGLAIDANTLENNPYK